MASAGARFAFSKSAHRKLAPCPFAPRRFAPLKLEDSAHNALRYGQPEYGIGIALRGGSAYEFVPESFGPFQQRLPGAHSWHEFAIWLSTSDPYQTIAMEAVFVPLQVAFRGVSFVQIE